jgi:hypothetical protein
MPGTFLHTTIPRLLSLPSRENTADEWTHEMIIFQGGSFSWLFPFLNIFTLMIERKPVPVAIVLVTIFAEEREIDPLPANRTGLVHGVLLLLCEP